MAPPRAAGFTVGHLAGFDDEALETFLAPGDAGVDARRLGRALQGGEHDHLTARVLRALAPHRAAEVAAGRARPVPAAEVERARRHVVDVLFWPLLYWHDPDGYEELVAGEQIDQRLLDSIDLEGRAVADVGAGSGRYTLVAARRAARVIAVDAVPALLVRLEAHASARGLGNIETRRGSFLRLPLDDGAVDVAVACSSLTSHAPFGGEPALTEADRVLRPGGELVIIWPDDPGWFTERGFAHRNAPNARDLRMAFPSVEAAERVCRAFYSEDAARWVRDHHACRVPYDVLGVPPPSDACVRIKAAADRRPDDDDHALHGVVTG